MAQQPAIYRSQYADSIAALLARQGDIAAQGAERSGAIWGNAVNNLGQIAGQAVAQHQEKKAAGKQAAALDAFMESDLWVRDPKAGLAGAIKILGPVKGVQFFEGLQSSLKVKEAQSPAEARASLPSMSRAFMATPVESRPKMWTGIGQLFKSVGLIQPEDPWGEYNPEEHDPIVASFAAEGVTARPEGVIVETVGPDGKAPIKRRVTEAELAQGVPVYQAPKSDAPKAGSFEAFVAANPGQDVLQLRARWEAAGRKPEGSDKSKIWVVRDGKPLRISEDEYQPGDQPTGARERPVTGAERRVLSFYMRAQEASDNVEALEDKVKASGAFEQARRQWAPNILQSTDDQLYRQAQRAFTEARLRKDSGATIKKDEYESDAKTYFAQPGDSDKVLEQKRRGRAKVLESLRAESGRAHSEYFGEEAYRPGGQVGSVGTWTEMTGGKIRELP